MEAKVPYTPPRPPYPGAQTPYPGAQAPYPAGQAPYPGAQTPYQGGQVHHPYAPPGKPTPEPTSAAYQPQVRNRPDPAALAAAFARNGYKGYMVVRREFISNRFDPTLTVRSNNISFNTTCLKQLDGVVYINLLVNPLEHRLVIRPCREGTRDAIRWCTVREDKRKSRQITCPDFTEKLYNLMGWEQSHRFRLQGTQIPYNDEQIFIFDLTATEEYTAPIVDDNGRRRAGERILPEALKDSFGMSVEDHQKYMDVDLKKGYVGGTYELETAEEADSTNREAVSV